MGLQRRLQEGSDANGAVVTRPTNGQGFHPEKQRRRDGLQDDASNRGTTPSGAVVIAAGRLSSGESRPSCVPTSWQSTIPFPGLALLPCLPAPRLSHIITLPSRSHPPLSSSWSRGGRRQMHHHGTVGEAARMPPPAAAPRHRQPPKGRNAVSTRRRPTAAQGEDPEHEPPPLQILHASSPPPVRRREDAAQPARCLS